MEPNIGDFDTEYLLGCVNVGRLSRFWRCRAASAQPSLHPLAHQPPQPQSCSSPVRLPFNISPESPKEWCAIETGWNMISKCLSDQKFSKKTFLKSCVHCCFSRPIRLDGTWGELSPVTASRNSKQDLKQINEPKTGIPGAPGQWPPSFPSRMASPPSGTKSQTTG